MLQTKALNRNEGAKKKREICLDKLRIRDVVCIYVSMSIMVFHSAASIRQLIYGISILLCKQFVCRFVGVQVTAMFTGSIRCSQLLFFSSTRSPPSHSSLSFAYFVS